MTNKILMLLLTVLLCSVSPARAVSLEESGSAEQGKLSKEQVSQPVEVPVTAPGVKKTIPTMDASESSADKVLITDLKSDSVMIEIHAKTRIKDYTVITLASPSRLVVELKNAESRLGEKIVINKLGIKEALFENNPAFLKITLEAAQGRIIPIPYRIEETDASLNIVITSP